MRPSGANLQMASFDESGGLHVVDHWDSPEQFQAFIEQKIGPAAQRFGITTQPQVAILSSDAHRPVRRTEDLTLCGCVHKMRPEKLGFLLISQDVALRADGSESWAATSSGGLKARYQVSRRWQHWRALRCPGTKTSASGSLSGGLVLIPATKPARVVDAGSGESEGGEPCEGNEEAGADDELGDAEAHDGHVEGRAQGDAVDELGAAGFFARELAVGAPGAEGVLLDYVSLRSGRLFVLDEDAGGARHPDWS